jgi:hypothetical protein
VAQHLLYDPADEGEPMQKPKSLVGTAKRVRVQMPFKAVRSAWDCRPFGFGCIVAPIASGTIEIAPGVDLDLSNGELWAVSGKQRDSA